MLVADASFDPSRSCLEGTRVEIIEGINHWALSSGSSPLFWLYALAGCGKSSVATSVAQLWYGTGVLAGSFFCKRDSPHLREPKNVISHLATLLGLKYPAYGTRLVDALRREPELAHSAARTRFKGLVVELLQSMSADTQPEGILTIVVDAVDEVPSTESRVELVDYLLEMSKLKPWLKVLMTSRPNEEIRLALESSEDRTERRDLFTEDETSVSRDIFAYISSRMIAIPAETAGREGWPDEADMHQLRDSSSGLFIWARTACNLIQQSFSPSNTMKQIIEGKRSKDAKKAIGEIYTTALNEGLGVTHDNAEVIQLCIGAIILTGSRRPLPDTALAAMLTSRVELHMLSRVISRLASVLYRDHTSAVRVLHQSFSDYMIEDCPKEYRINIAVQNAELAASCLEIMLQGLRFNICHLGDSCIMNRDVPNLQDRINRSIKPELLYSCIYWPTHLIQQPFSLTARSTIEHFAQLLHGKHILFWIEVLSLIGELHVASTAIARLIDWLDGSKSKYTKAAVELDRFISAAFPCISESAPHLYTSALPFGAVNYTVLRAMLAQFPNAVPVIGGLNLWNVRRVRTIQTEKEVSSITVSNDGRRIVSCSDDKTIRTWDAQTGAPLFKPLEGHAGNITSVAFSPDGRRIVSGSLDYTVRIWDAQTGASLLEPLEGHVGSVTSVAFSPDGRRIVSGSWDYTVRIWDAQTGAAFLKPLTGHTAPVESVAFSPDGRRIVSGSWDKTVRIWDALTGAAHLKPLKGHSGSVKSVAFSSDGRRIVSGSGDETVRIWDAQAGAALLKPLKGHTGDVTSVSFSADGRRLVSGSDDKTVRIWDAQTGVALLEPLDGHSDCVTSVTFSSDDRRIISGSKDKTVRIWDGQTGATLLDSMEGHSKDVVSVAFSFDGRRIVSGSWDRTVRTWDARTGTALLKPLEGHSNSVTSVAFSSDGQRIVSGSWDKTIRIWDAQTGATHLEPLNGHRSGVTAVVFSSDGGRIVSGSWDETVRIWDAQTGAALLDPLEGHSNYVTSVAISCDGRRIVSGSWDKTVRIWDAQTGAAHLAPLKGHTGNVTSVAFSPDGRRIISGSWDKTVRIWDAQTGAALLEPMKGHRFNVTSVAFSPDGQRIASGSKDKTVQIWDGQTGTALLKPLRGHSGDVASVAFSSDGQRIVSSSQDGAVWVWETRKTPNPFVIQDFLLDFSRFVYICDWSPCQ
ncbi:hypothetical protein FRC09_001444 [Ceratobasidium sp. 395]|nr:hypothetical protein FRC09_001444 [Ceratobasidium sp. 395]